MARTGEREIGAVSERLPDNPGELACMLKGEKLKLKDVVSPGIKLGTLRTEGCALTNRATEDGL